jgi:hypothetical protein
MEVKCAGKHILRRAKLSEIPALMDFLDRFWERGCLLSRDMAYFEYEFVVGSDLSFVVAVHKDTGGIDACIGFIRCSLKIPFDAFGVLWVANPKSGTKFLGLALNEYIPEIPLFRHVYGVGLRENTGAAISAHLYGVPPCKMRQFYRLAERREYKIAKISAPRYVFAEQTEKRLIPIPDMKHLRRWVDINALVNIVPYKDEWYFEWRYMKHPYYRFNVFGIADRFAQIQALLVIRKICVHGATALRIVDYWGVDAQLWGIGSELDRVMDAADAEYIDFYVSGIETHFVESAGFVLRDETDANIIPNHFEPFEQKNTDIFVTTDQIRFFKGDGDQGRPRLSRLPEDWVRGSESGGS